MILDRYITLHRNDLDFRRFLDGYDVDVDGKAARPVPIRSMNILTNREEVTFRLRSVTATWAEKAMGWIRLLRLDRVIFVTGPLFVIWLLAISQGYQIETALGLLASLGILSFYFSLNLLNDYSDHTRGPDRARPVGGSRSIQDGLIPAHLVKKVGFGFFVVAASIAMRVLVVQPSLVQKGSLVALALVLLLSIDFFLPRVWFRGRGGADLVAFFLAGPLLTSSFALITMHTVTYEILALGAVFGSIVGLSVYLERFARMMHDQQEGYKTWPVRLGFDAAKAVAQFLVFVSVGWLMFDLIIIDKSWYLWPGLVTLVGFCLPLSMRIGRVQSPLASEMSLLPGEVLKLHWITSGVLATGYATVIAVSANSP